MGVSEVIYAIWQVNSLARIGKRRGVKVWICVGMNMYDICIHLGRSVCDMYVVQVW